MAARYDLARVRDVVGLDEIGGRSGGLWRWREVLPLPVDAEPVDLGEGETPCLPLPRLGQELGLDRLFVKDESLNPTGSFKARGMAVAVSMARVLGATKLAAPSAGNAGGALAAYGARAGLDVQLAIPVDTPEANRIEAEICGARVHTLDGTIADCGAWIRDYCAREGAFDLSTLKEPYRVEGKKTMGYELALQFDGQLPDVILYPTGGGTGLVGMMKAFDEMRELGWIASKSMPRMFAVQAEGCDPVVQAFNSGADHSVAPKNPRTVAAGLRVPTPIGDRWMLRDIARSGGGAISVSDPQLLAGTRDLARHEGIFCAPEAGALIAALRRLVSDQVIGNHESVVLFNTGSGLKYLECFGH